MSIPTNNSVMIEVQASNIREAADAITKKLDAYFCGSRYQFSTEAEEITGEITGEDVPVVYRVRVVASNYGVPDARS